MMIITYNDVGNNEGSNGILFTVVDTVVDAAQTVWDTITGWFS